MGSFETEPTQPDPLAADACIAQLNARRKCPIRPLRCLKARSRARGRAARPMEFTHFVQLIAIGLQARIPMHMTGFPGVGKTEFTKSLEAGFDARGREVQGLHPGRVHS